MNDVAIVGAGPAGTSCAIALAQRGIRTTLIEKDAFPRYHIGESMTGECGNVVRALGLEADMQRLRYPVKRGVRVFAPDGDHSFWVPVMGRDPDGGLLDATTWQVRRSEFDALLLDVARARASEHVHGEATGVLGDGDTVSGVRVRADGGRETEIPARVVVDASGPACFLSRCGVTGPRQRGKYDNQVAIFSQVRGSVREPGEHSGNTLIFYRETNHWAWFIPLDDEVVSVGVVVPSDHFRTYRLPKEDFLRKAMRELNPNLSARLEDATLVEDVRTASSYSFEISDYTGPAHLCVGDAHRFIDPVFSFGLHFAMVEGQLAAAAIERHLAGEAADPRRPFLDYQNTTTRGMDKIQDLIDCFWQRPVQFALVVHQKHREEAIDLFAGRLYDEKPSGALMAIQQILAKSRGELAGRS